MNPAEHPMFDLEYVFLQIRAKSVGEIAKIKVLCPDSTDEDKQYGEIEVDLTKVEVFLDDNHTNNVVLDEKRKLGLVLKYPGLDSLSPEMVAGKVKLSDSYDMIEGLIEQIYEGENVTFAKDTEKGELRTFIDGLSNDQMRKVLNFFDTAPRLEQKVKVTNPKTKVESEVTLRGLSDFFG